MSHTAFELMTNLDVMDSLLKPANLFLIDAGCGDMSLTRELSKRGANVLAIDPDPIQAEKNRALSTIPNVGFAETGADELPVEDSSIDGILFSYSLHHVPEALYPAVFREALRVLKPDGFLYVLEPVAGGDLYDVMSMFHDETQVRAQAQEALKRYANPAFEQVQTFSWYREAKYTGWEEFANHYAGLSYNASYTEEQIRAPDVQHRFESLGRATNYRFEVPMLLTFLQNPTKSRIT